MYSEQLPDTLGIRVPAGPQTVNPDPNLYKPSYRSYREPRELEHGFRMISAGIPFALA